MKENLIYTKQMNSIIMTLFVLILMLNVLCSVQADKAVHSGLLSKEAYPRPGSIPLLNRKVLKGYSVTTNEHPYIVSIRRYFAHYLTATLLSRNVVITVAHPLYRVPIYEIGVVIGEHFCDRGTAIYTVVLIVFRLDFDPYTLVGDVSVLRLYENIDFKISVKPIAGIHSSTNHLENKKAFVTGWGRCDTTGVEMCLPRSNIYYRDEKLDPQLKTVTFSFREDSPYCNGYLHNGLEIQVGMVCAGASRIEDEACACMAVPGAPLVVDAQLLGLQSWGFGCGYLHDLPLIYTDVRKYHGWISYASRLLFNITKKNFSQLYQATKAYRAVEFYNYSRKHLKSYNITTGDSEMQPLEVDKYLCRFIGTVYDIRDFIYNSSYHKSKGHMYSMIKSTLIRYNKNRSQKLTDSMSEEQFSSDDGRDGE